MYQVMYKIYNRIVMNVFHSENIKTHINIKHSRIVLFGIKRKKIDNFVPPGPSLPPDLRGSSKHLERYRRIPEDNFSA